MRAYDEYMMSIQNQPPMDMGPPMGPPGMGMGPPGMMPHHMPPPVHFPPDGFYGHPHMGPPPPHMMGGMMGGPPPGHFIGGRGGGFRGGRGF